MNFAARSTSAIRSNPRRLWAVSFTLFLGTGLVWAVTTPPFGAGDEPAHVVRAVAIVEHGDFHGTREGDPAHSFERIVQVPAIYRDSGVRASCYAFRPNVTPGCASFTGGSQDVDTSTYAVRHPPTYYLIVGFLTAWADPLFGLDLMRAITAAICAALLASATVSMFERRNGVAAPAGMLLALTPMTLYLSGVVNPNGPEIAAGVAVWISGLRLATESGSIPPRLVLRLGLAASVLVLARESSPFWLLLIGLALLALTSRDRLRVLVNETRVRIWAGVLVLLAAAQSAWDLAVSPFGLQDRRFAIEGSTTEIVRAAIGEVVPNFKESIGTFGWFSDPAPMPTILLWTAGLAVLLAVALAFARRREALVILGLTVVSLGVPIVGEASIARDAGLSWQGRYVLPFAVGVPLLSALVLGRTRRLDASAARRLTAVIAIVFVVGQSLAYAQQLRRYTVGRDGSVLFFLDWRWSPPLPPWFLLLAFVACIGGIAALLTLHPSDTEPEDTQVASATTTP